MFIKKVLEAMVGMNARYGGSGKAPTVQTVADTPAPPPPVEEAMLEEATTDDVTKKKAKTQGAKSLQIPLVGTSGSNATVGTI